MRVDKLELPGKFKAWIYQHGILPHLQSVLMVCEIVLIMVCDKKDPFLRNCPGHYLL